MRSSWSEISQLQQQQQHQHQTATAGGASTTSNTANLEIQQQRRNLNRQVDQNDIRITERDPYDTTLSRPAAPAASNDTQNRRRSFQEYYRTENVTKRIAEEAQDDELLQLALELSIGDGLNYSEHSATTTTTPRHHQHMNQNRTTAPGTATTSSINSTVDIRPTTRSNSLTSTPASSYNATHQLQHQHSQQRQPYPQPMSRHNSSCTAASSSPTSASSGTVSSTFLKDPPKVSITTIATSSTNTSPVVNINTLPAAAATVAPYRRSILRQTPSTRSLEQYPQQVHHQVQGQQQQQQQYQPPSSVAVATTPIPDTSNIVIQQQRYQRPSLIQQNLSSRSLEDFIFGSNRSSSSPNKTTTTEERRLGDSNSGGVGRSRYNDHDSNSIDDLEDMDDDDDDDDDNDNDDLEDLDPDDTPDLRRVAKEQQRQPRSNTSNKLPSSIDLQAATEQFRKNMMATKKKNMLTSSLSMDRNQQKRPGVESVKSAAPKVKPPGRPRTAVSRQSPAIDDDVLLKIKKNDNGSSTATDSTTSSATKAQKPGVVAVKATPITTKTPEARSAIVSHILNSTDSSTNHHQSNNRTPTQSQSATERRKRFNVDVGLERSLSSDDQPVRSPVNLGTKKSIDQQQRHDFDRSVDHIGTYSDHSPYQHQQQQERYQQQQLNQQPLSSASSTNAWNTDTNVHRRQSGSTLVSNDWPSLTEQQKLNKSPEIKNKLDDSYAPPELFNLERVLLGATTRRFDQESAPMISSPKATDTRTQSSQSASTRRSSDTYDLSAASAYLSQEELLNIQEALKDESMLSANEYNGMSMQLQHTQHVSQQKTTMSSVATVSGKKLSPDEEAAAIARALQEADEEEERKSFELAMLMQHEEALQYKSKQLQQSQHNQGNVRTMTRQQYAVEQFQQYASTTNGSNQIRSTKMQDHDLDEGNVAEGFRMNSSVQHKWSRFDQSSVVGPNNEIRTKHDRSLHNEANSHRLGLLPDNNNTTGAANVGNQAYNSFIQSMKSTNKGVASKGTGRAGSDSDATKGGAMDPMVRQLISSAINNEIIEKCNGVVKEGKEAIIYHADKGAESGGFDVAVKVFKKIQEFRNRSYYVDGDPRYGNTNFKNLSSKEQLEVWAEKEFRNLTRASRAGVPVPIPLFHKENVLFMRFLGDDGWPAPQLRELDLNHGSRRWMTLFTQVIEAMKLLYQGGHLVHGDLSEYNILVAPSYFVVGPSVAIGHTKNGKNMMNGEDLQIVLIDFGQAVDTRHPEASNLLQRDVDRVLTFFAHQGIEIPTLDDTMAIIMG